MIVNQPSITAATALHLVQGALDEAQVQGISIAVCVTDPHGQVLASLRMEGSTPPMLSFAEDKAYTAATMRSTTEAFSERMSASPALALGLSSRPRLLAWGGGLPIVHERRVIGGIGVAGAQDHQNIACAKAALSARELGWEG